MTPAIDEHEPGSAKIPSVRGNVLNASIISSSDTDVINPFDSSRAFVANCQLAGFPMRIAVAIVSGNVITSSFVIAADPSASNPYIFGNPTLCRSLYSLKPFQ